MKAHLHFGSATNPPMQTVGVACRPDPANESKHHVHFEAVWRKVRRDAVGWFATIDGERVRVTFEEEQNP